MNNSRWLKMTVSLGMLFLLVIVIINFYIDTYGVRLSLYSLNRTSGQVNCLTDINQHIFNPEFIFRNSDRFDSFLFGSSRTGVIDVNKIKSGGFFNMSYTQGLPAEHLAMVKAFLRKGIKVKSILVGLDEFSFAISPREHENELLRIMHPYITGDSLTSIFLKYYFRIPKLFELANGEKLLFNYRQGDKFILSQNGLNLFWLNKDYYLKYSLHFTY